MADLASIRTKVRNTSGGELFFGFLGPHGVSLTDDEYYSFVGDLKSLVAGNARKEKALNNALDTDQLVIITDPLPVHLDDTTKNVRHVVPDNDLFGVAHPDWGEYDTVAGHA
jgi:hypothetical protein